MSKAQLFTRIFGAVYVAVGLVGFAGFVGGTASQTPSMLLGIFGVTLAHNIVHLAVGAAFLAGSFSNKSAQAVSLVIGSVYLLVGVVGVANIDFINTLLNINLADNLLHLGTGALFVLIGLPLIAPARGSVRTV